MGLFGKKKDEHSGFMGDLSEKQEEALEEFRQIIKEENITDDPRYDDYYLLRFLRARKFNIKKTLEMFENFLEWRDEKQANDAMVIYKCPNIDELKEIYHHGYHKTDKEGRPFYIDQPCTFDITEALSIADSTECEQYYIREYEKLLHWRLPACSEAAGYKIEQSFSLINVKGFSMGKLKAKSREFIKIAIKIGQDYYPEIMGKMFIINTPFVFKAAWAIFSPFIDAKTKKKITMMGSSYKKELFKHVDPENVPAEIGGECECTSHPKGCFFADEGPWNDHKGDQFYQEATNKLLEEEKQKEFEPDSLSNESMDQAEQESKEVDQNMVDIELEDSNTNNVQSKEENNSKRKKKGGSKGGCCLFLCCAKKS
ncbi:unnamed protein product [Moneuplotes crassus]|uniref:CRAL-TRIO domain-containing protein n=1 Tax=Euplotes crassus TaxID=5936 RepID=A0AAD1UJD3_EUPCR|nr:unnamed protein product [Moneuplotes crassus]